MIAILLPDGTARTPRVNHGDDKSQSAAGYDAELVRQFKAGNEAAFVEIVARFRKRILAAAFSLVRNAADAEDVVQDTFISAHRGLAQFRGDSSLATWLYRIATNLSRNHYWYFVRRRRHAMLPLDVPMAEDSDRTVADVLLSDEPSPTHVVARGEFAALIIACMAKLHARHREILRLRNDFDQSYDEIAAVLGIEVGTVKSRLARARGSLRRLLAESCPEIPAAAPLSEWFEPNRGGGRFKVTSN